MVKAKTGRKQRHHETAWGETINGLSRQPDGRWRVIGTAIRFTEPDERLAVAKFRRMNKSDPVGDAILISTTEPDRYGDRVAELIRGLQRDLEETGTPFAVIDPVLFWGRVRREILERPKWVAEQTGIEQIGYLLDLEPPKPSPSLKSLGAVWWEHAEVTDVERRKVRDAWDDFIATSGLKDLRGIKTESAVAFRDAVAGRGWSVKTMRHRFNRVRRVLSFAQERAFHVEECARALAHLTFKLKRTRTITLPRPISRADFSALLGAATGDDKAMILLMANAALYLQEVVRVRWEELEGGVFVSKREKKGQSLRVAVLWPETVAALADVKRRGDHVFVAETGLPLTVSGAGKRFRKVRVIAGVPDVAGSHLRDGAYQAMAENNINADLCKLVVGHSCGLKDNYVLRSPKMVAPACEAIRLAYLGGDQK